MTKLRVLKIPIVGNSSIVLGWRLIRETNYAEGKSTGLDH